MTASKRLSNVAIWMSGFRLKSNVAPADLSRSSWSALSLKVLLGIVPR